MFASWQRSWDLTKASWEVLKSDKELLIFPIVSLVGSIIVLISFAIPMLLTGGFGSVDARGEVSQPSIAAIIVTFLFYLVNYTIIIFSNTALVGAAMMRLEGQDPTLRDGINIAMSRLSTILGYAAISATVGMIIKAIEGNRKNILAQIVASLIGMMWTVVTFMVIPVLVVENVGPIEAIKRSAALLKKTWGEQLVGSGGVGLVFGLLSIGIIILGIGLVAIVASLKSTILIVIAVAILVLALIGLGLVGSALGSVYQAALYRYAVTGEINPAFPADAIQGAFKPKNS